MNPWLILALVAGGWLVVVVLLLIANHERAEAGKRFDQSMTEHFDPMRDWLEDDQ